MDIWANSVITTKGLALQAKLIAGTALTITRAVTGTGTVAAGVLQSQTAVTGEKQTMTFRGFTYPEPGRCSLPCRISNTGLTEGYTAKQVGVYAQDPDDGEILFIIMQAESGNGTVIPSESESPGYIAEWIVNFKYGQADSVELSVDPAGTVTAQEMEVYVEEVLTGAKEEIQSKLDGKAPTSHASDTSEYGVSTSTKYGHAKSGSAMPKANGDATSGTESGVFSRVDHVHPMQKATYGVTTKGDGAAYSATVEGITELKAGASFVMIPHTVSTSTSPTLDVNDLGAKNLRRRLSNMTSTTQVGYTNGWIASNKPVHVVYDGTYWIVEELAKPSAADLYGTVSIEKGGTGGTTAEEARENLGVLTIDEIVNIYLWKKFSYISTKVALNGTTSNTVIQYSSSIRVGSNNVIELVDPTEITLTQQDDPKLNDLVGKYFKQSNKVFFITSDFHVTYENQMFNISKCKAFREFIGYVSSKSNDTYPECGDDGNDYFYFYHKQLGE